jgi:hypothetical protein
VWQEEEGYVEGARRRKREIIGSVVLQVDYFYDRYWSNYSAGNAYTCSNRDTDQMFILAESIHWSKNDGIAQDRKDSRVRCRDGGEARGGGGEHGCWSKQATGLPGQLPLMREYSPPSLSRFDGNFDL